MGAGEKEDKEEEGKEKGHEINREKEIEKEEKKSEGEKIRKTRNHWRGERERGNEGQFNECLSQPYKKLIFISEIHRHVMLRLQVDD
jgi:hypothetical protein